MPSPNHVHKSTRVRRRIRSVADLSRSDRRNLWARALDVLLIVILAASPLVFGGRYDGGKFVFVLLVAVAMCVWAIGSIVDRSCRWYGSHALWLVGVGTVLLALQLAPRGQSPPLAESLLPAWSSADSVGAWRQATFTPAETRGGMVMLLAYGGLFFLAVQRMRSIGDVERMLAAMGLVVLGLAVLGLLQYLASNERYWWFYQHPWRSPSNVVKGPFDNRNHFAHFLALGLGPLMWWWLRRANVQHESSRPQRIQTTQLPARAARATIVGAVAMAIVIFAALMTFSRAGCLMILVALAISTVAYLRIGWIGKKPAVAMLGCAVLVATALSIHGYGGLANRLDDYAMGSVDSLDRSHARRKIWAANIAGIRKNDVLGAGVGSHRHLYPVYLKSSPTTEYTHAESGYLQLLLEAGWPGLVLLLIGIAVASKWALAGWSADTSASDGRRIYACAVPIAAGLAVCALHSFVDFVWYITACVAMADDPADHVHGVLGRDIAHEVGSSPRFDGVNERADGRPHEGLVPLLELGRPERSRDEVAIGAVLLAIHADDQLPHVLAHRGGVDRRREGSGVAQRALDVTVARDAETLAPHGPRAHDRALRGSGLGPVGVGLAMHELVEGIGRGIGSCRSLVVCGHQGPSASPLEPRVSGMNHSYDVRSATVNQTPAGAWPASRSVSGLEPVDQHIGEQATDVGGRQDTRQTRAVAHDRGS